MNEKYKRLGIAIVVGLIIIVVLVVVQKRNQNNSNIEKMKQTGTNGVSLEASPVSENEDSLVATDSAAPSFPPQREKPSGSPPSFDGDNPPGEMPGGQPPQGLPTETTGAI